MRRASPVAMVSAAVARLSPPAHPAVGAAATTPMLFRETPTDGAGSALVALRRSLQISLDGLDALNQQLSHGATDGRPQRLAAALTRSHRGLLSQLDDQIGAPPPQTFADADISVFDPGDLAEDVAALFWRRAVDKGLDLAIYVDPATPRKIRADQTLMQHLLAGLVEEALGETQAGGVLIEMEVDGQNRLSLSLHDTRAVHGDAPQDWLAPHRRRAEALGGVLALSRQSDRGVSIDCRLPMAVVEPATDWPRLPAPALGAEPAFALLIYPGPSTRRAVMRYLNAAGLTVRSPQIAPRPELACLVVSDAQGLARLEAGAVSTLCITGPDDAAPPRAPGADRAPALLRQPLQRRDIAAYLNQLVAGDQLESPSLKAEGYGRALVYLPTPPEAPNATLAERDLLRDLSEAIQNGGLSLVYQPQVDREGERIIGVEALVRWLHPRLGPISPGVFIPFAERHGCIKDVTAWVIDKVLEETQYLHGLQVALNVSALEFSDQGFVDSLLAAVDRHGYDARRLEVEITETAILQHEDPVQDSISRLHAVGIGVALDDFGAGYSSLSHLRRYPFDKLKIDREFITHCSGDMQSATVVHAVVSIGRALGMKVIAEGVETEVQHNFLRVAGVHAMQGYLFGRPAPIEQMSSLLTPRDRRSRT